MNSSIVHPLDAGTNPLLGFVVGKEAAVWRQVRRP
jgi:hypothetical protein